MSGTSGVEASGPSGVQNGVPFQELPTDAGASADVRDPITQAERLVPAGLKALCDAYSRLYPDQPNPLQVTTRLKYWLGGNDPLDYISMYYNPGKPEENIPPHWHYVSFGLSDLHGDGRAHPPPDRVVLASDPTYPSSRGMELHFDVIIINEYSFGLSDLHGDGRAHPPPDRVVLASDPTYPSGRGMELTLRLKAETPNQPPLWPAALLQSLARYVFTTGNKFYPGDHITWHAALDGGGTKSRVRHLLVAEDAQLPTIGTAHGSVSFLQMVGCTSRELKAAQRGSGMDVLKFLAGDPRCGGSWHVTVMSRARSARGLRVSARGAAVLAGVSARVRWTHWSQISEEHPPSPSELSPTVEQMIKDTLQRGLTSMTDRSGPEGHMSTDSFEMSSIERALPQIPELMQGSWRNEDIIEYLDSVHLTLNTEGASLLPLAIDGRVLHDRHFTWRGGCSAVTVLGQRVAGAACELHRPYAARGGWLQILIPKDLAEEMSRAVAILSSLSVSDSESDSEEETHKVEPPRIPLTLSWPKHRLKITVLHDHDML